MLEIYALSRYNATERVFCRELKGELPNAETYS